MAGVTNPDTVGNWEIAAMAVIAALALWRARPGRVPAKLGEVAPRWGRGLRERPWLFALLVAFFAAGAISRIIALIQAKDLSQVALSLATFAWQSGFLAVLVRLRDWPDPNPG